MIHTVTSADGVTVPALIYSHKICALKAHPNTLTDVSMSLGKNKRNTHVHNRIQTISVARFKHHIGPLKD